MLFPSASVYGACADAGTESAACGIVTGKHARNGRSLRAFVSMGGPPPGAEHAGPVARGLEYLRDGRGGVGKRLLTGGLDGRIALNRRAAGVLARHEHAPKRGADRRSPGPRTRGRRP